MRGTTASADARAGSTNPQNRTSLRRRKMPAGDVCPFCHGPHRLPGVCPVEGRTVGVPDVETVYGKPRVVAPEEMEEAAQELETLRAQNERLIALGDMSTALSKRVNEENQNLKKLAGELARTADRLRFPMVAPGGGIVLEQREKDFADAKELLSRPEVVELLKGGE